MLLYFMNYVMTLKNINLTLTAEEYEWLINALFEAEISVDRLIEAVEKEEGKAAPDLVQRSFMYFNLRLNIQKQKNERGRL